MSNTISLSLSLPPLSLPTPSLSPHSLPRPLSLSLDPLSLPTLSLSPHSLSRHPLSLPTPLSAACDSVNERGQVERGRVASRISPVHLASSAQQSPRDPVINFTGFYPHLHPMTCSPQVCCKQVEIEAGMSIMFVYKMYGSIGCIEI